MTAELDDTRGVDVVDWSIVTTDETTSIASYVIKRTGPKGSIAQWSALGRGTAGIVECRINCGIDKATNRPSPQATSARAKFFVPTDANREVICAGETIESDATFGYTGLVNAAIRGAEPQSPTGAWTRLTCLAGAQTTMCTKDKPHVCGGCFFVRNDAKAIRWRALLLASDAKSTARIALFDPSGTTTGGAPGYVPKSTLATSSTQPTLCEADLTAEVAKLASGVFAVHLFVEPIQSTSAAYALWAALDLE